jgi:hypothetical protein
LADQLWPIIAGSDKVDLQREKRRATAVCEVSMDGFSNWMCDNVHTAGKK